MIPYVHEPNPHLMRLWVVQKSDSYHNENTVYIFLHKKRAEYFIQCDRQFEIKNAGDEYVKSFISYDLYYEIVDQNEDENDDT